MSNWRIVGLTLGSVLLVLVVSVGSVLWIVTPRDDVPDDPDVVVVLGGAGAERAALGISLADRYDVPLVLSSSAGIFGERQGRTCGVDAICFEPVPENTAGEAENVARMAEAQGWDHVTVATSAFHTGRSRWLFRQCLGGDRVSVVGASSERRGLTNPYLMTREALGVIAGTTIARAC
ncbi:MAG: YdcF family protein [Nitriliruptoraceae bacterium]|nr:YdcF family protein [Nitriliruptoraceae bacterium]